MALLTKEWLAAKLVHIVFNWLLAHAKDEKAVVDFVVDVLDRKDPKKK